MINPRYSMANYAENFIGLPYSYGGNGPWFDCGSLMGEIFRAHFTNFPHHDINSQGIRELLKKSKGVASVDFNHAKKYPGVVILYGSTNKTSEHIAMTIRGGFLIEAGGGHASTLTPADASKDGAFVRVRPIEHRLDIIDMLDLDYENMDSSFKFGTA